MESRQNTNPRDEVSRHISDIKYYISKKNIEMARRSYQLALESHNSILGRNAEHNRSFSNSCYQLATTSFNSKQYQEAAFYYEQSIQQLVGIEQLNDCLGDADFRKLVNSFINLSDAFMHLLNRDAAALSFENAIKAFNFIREKSMSELVIAQANDNYVSFRDYYEKKLSTSSYLVSREFKNNDQIIHNAYEVTVVEKSLTELFVSEKIECEDDIASLMDNMDLTTPSLFMELPINHSLSDDKYRSAAKEYLYIARNLYSQQLIHDAVKTIEQSLNAYKQVRQKTQHDLTDISMLQQQLAQLREQLNAPRTSSFGLFSTTSHSQTHLSHNHTNDYNNIPRSSFSNHY